METNIDQNGDRFYPIFFACPFPIYNLFISFKWYINPLTEYGLQQPCTKITERECKEYTEYFFKYIDEQLMTIIVSNKYFEWSEFLTAILNKSTMTFDFWILFFLFFFFPFQPVKITIVKGVEEDSVEDKWKELVHLRPKRRTIKSSKEKINK